MAHAEGEVCHDRALHRSSSAWKSTCNCSPRARCSARAARSSARAPNTQTCPVCIGMPGSLPVMNRQAVELAQKTAVALNCQIARVHQVGPEELLLSRSAQGLSDQPIRPAAELRRLAGDQRSQGADRAEAGGHHPRPPRRGRRQEHARRGGGQGRQPHRLEPLRRAAAGNRQPARHALARRGQGLSDRVEAAC